MNGKALGIIETMGLVPAVEAGDVAVKTADVTLIGLQAVGGGFVSLLMKGDVSAVKASVDAGSSAASRLGTVCSVTVIARTAEGLGGILMEEAKRPACFPERGAVAPTTPETPPHGAVETGVVAASTPVDALDGPAQGDLSGVETLSVDSGDGETLTYAMADLKKLKVTKLRRLARQLPAFSIPRGEIKFAKKSDLLEAFTQYMNTLAT